MVPMRLQTAAVRTLVAVATGAVVLSTAVPPAFGATPTPAAPTVASGTQLDPQGPVGPEPGVDGGTLHPRDSVAASTMDSSAIIARGESWTIAAVPYSQTTYLNGYRTDCSGFVSMAWGLTGSYGEPISLTTQTLPNVATQISVGQLMPGDILDYNSTADPVNGSHVVLFGGWVDRSEKYYYGLEEAGDSGAIVHIIPFPYFAGAMDGTSTWIPYRYNGTVVDLPAIPPVPLSPPEPPDTPWETAWNGSAVTLAWSPSVTATSYVVLVDGATVATVSGTSATVGGLAPDTAIEIQIEAVNAKGPSPPSTPAALVSPTVAVGVVADPVGGYWVVADDGGVFSYAGAHFYGSTGGLHLNKPVVGMAATPDGGGYWLVAADGGLFAFGDAHFYGSTGGLHLNKPVVGMAATPDGGGYWLAAADGGIFAFGDARFYGSTGAYHLNRPVVGMAATPDGGGYWLVASDGGLFTFGDARFYGSTGAYHLNRPVVGMAATPDGGGYWLVASDGGIFTFGDARYEGSLGGMGYSDVAGMEAGIGYLLVHRYRSGGTWLINAFGPSIGTPNTVAG